MSDPVANITAVTIDANDASTGAAFWADLTGTSVLDVVVEGRLHFLSAAEVLALGGSWSGMEQTLDEYTWRSFQDPEGTEFDVLLA